MIHSAYKLILLIASIFWLATVSPIKVKAQKLELSFTKDYNTEIGGQEGEPVDFTYFEGHVYFVATTIEHGRELFRTNGDSGHVEIVGDLIPGIKSSYPKLLGVHNNTLYLLATDSNEAVGFYRWDNVASSVTPIPVDSAFKAYTGQYLNGKFHGQYYYQILSDTLNFDRWVARTNLHTGQLEILFETSRFSGIEDVFVGVSENSIYLKQEFYFSIKENLWVVNDTVNAQVYPIEKSSGDTLSIGDVLGFRGDTLLLGNVKEIYFLSETDFYASKVNVTNFRDYLADGRRTLNQQVGHRVFFNGEIAGDSTSRLLEIDLKTGNVKPLFPDSVNMLDFVINGDELYAVVGADISNMKLIAYSLNNHTIREVSSTVASIGSWTIQKLGSSVFYSNHIEGRSLVSKGGDISKITGFGYGVDYSDFGYLPSKDVVIHSAINTGNWFSPGIRGDELARTDLKDGQGENAFDLIPGTANFAFDKLVGGNQGILLQKSTENIPRVEFRDGSFIEYPDLPEGFRTTHVFEDRSSLYFFGNIDSTTAGFWEYKNGNYEKRIAIEDSISFNGQVWGEMVTFLGGYNLANSEYEFWFFPSNDGLHSVLPMPLAPNNEKINSISKATYGAGYQYHVVKAGAQGYIMRYSSVTRAIEFIKEVKTNSAGNVNLIVFDNNLYVYEAISGIKPFRKYDLETLEESAVLINGFVDNPKIRDFRILNGFLFFTADIGSERRLYYINRNDDFIKAVRDNNGDPFLGVNLYPVVNGRIIFTTYTLNPAQKLLYSFQFPEDEKELLCSDRDKMQGYLGVYDNKLLLTSKFDYYFRDGGEVFYTDGTLSGTHDLSFDESGYRVTGVASSVESKEGLFVIGYNQLYGKELHKISGTCEEVISNEIINVGGSLEVTSGYDSYQWYDCSTGLPIVNANSNILTPEKPGTYFVAIEYLQCTTRSDCKSVASSQTGIEETNNSSMIVVYPNPSKGNFELKSTSIIESLEIFDLSGRMVYSETPDRNVVSIDIQGQAKGMYLLKARSKTGIHTQQILLK